MVFSGEKPEQAEAAQAQRAKVGERRVGNDRYARPSEDRAAALYHTLKGLMGKC